MKLEALTKTVERSNVRLQYMKSNVSIIEKGVSIAILIAIASMYVFSIIHFSDFKEVFESFEAGLPWDTNAIISTFYYWVVFVILGGFGAFELVVNNKRYGCVFLVMSFCVLLFLVVFGIFSMNSPLLGFSNAT